jgi:hypothetical protein
LEQSKVQLAELVQQARQEQLEMQDLQALQDPQVFRAQLVLSVPRAQLVQPPQFKAPSVSQAQLGR